MPDGSCAAETDVAYVTVAGTGTTCTKVAPCGTLDNGIKANKSVVKIASGLIKDNKTTPIDAKAVTILADLGAKLDRDGDGAILNVSSSGADVKIYDLEITGASGVAGANGIDLSPNGGMPKMTLTRVKVYGNQGVGISASGGFLTVSQSTISSNVGGGIYVGGSGATFNITNNFIFRNGDQDNGVYGGINIAVASAAGSR
ncbi:MAG: right-handed parallel beta-helix repeat-containing protein, partial [Deltaproteobacteria bacterium]|nr:right-handed parallel beta-helix repeat-containing protein [Deltaproteobacteria bacterium]